MVQTHVNTAVDVPNQNQVAGASIADVGVYGEVSAGISGDEIRVLE